MINDSFQIDQHWQELKRIVNEKDAYEKRFFEEDLYKFLGEKKNIEASIRIKRKLRAIEKLANSMWKNVVNQRRQNDMDYEDRNIG